MLGAKGTALICPSFFPKFLLFLCVRTFVLSSVVLIELHPGQGSGSTSPPNRVMALGPPVCVSLPGMLFSLLYSGRLLLIPQNPVLTLLLGEALPPSAFPIPFQGWSFGTALPFFIIVASFSHLLVAGDRGCVSLPGWFQCCVFSGMGRPEKTLANITCQGFLFSPLSLKDKNQGEFIPPVLRFTVTYLTEKGKSQLQPGHVTAAGCPTSP